jgi:hypothetical protein
MIKAKDWCLYRDPNSGIGALIGKMLPINCGDMVIVTTGNDNEFQWDTTLEDIDHAKTRARSPQSNGMCERSIRPFSTSSTKLLSVRNYTPL